MIGLVRFEQQHGLRPVGQGVELREEEGVSRGDDPVGHEEAGISVVRMQAVALPRIVTEDDVRPDLANARRDLETLAEPRLELAVGPAEEDHLALASERY